MVNPEVLLNLSCVLLFLEGLKSNGMPLDALKLPIRIITSHLGGPVDRLRRACL
jgi:hypothetical protein